MKKILGFMVAFVLCVPFVVSAEEDYKFNCTTNDNVKTCTFSYNFKTEVTDLTISLTEEGGADITSITAATDEWDLSTSEVNGVHTVNLYTHDLEPVQGEYDLIKFSYIESGMEDCQVSLNFEGANLTPQTPSTNTPADQEPTGATLPYIALGVIALGAIGAYVVTKNKSKMYRI